MKCATPISRLTLGTVQLGMPYGIANTQGQPEYRHAVAILATALEGGIMCFDTAAVYGNSEEVLGRALRELGVLEDVLIVTKVRHLEPHERADAKLAAQTIEKSVDASRQRLGLDCIPIVMFHNQHDAIHADALDALRERGWAGQIGFSLAQPPAAPLNVDPCYTALQLPGNLLDRWPRDPAIVASLTRPGLAVFLRSVYLQGLLVMPVESIPPHLAEVLPVRRRLADIAAAGGMTEAELSLRYALSLDTAASVLIGVETPEQLRENIRLAAKGTLAPEIMVRIDRAATGVSEQILSPSAWPGLAKKLQPESVTN